MAIFRKIYAFILFYIHIWYHFCMMYLWICNNISAMSEKLQISSHLVSINQWLSSCGDWRFSCHIWPKTIATSGLSKQGLPWFPYNERFPRVCQKSLFLWRRKKAKPKELVEQDQIYKSNSILLSLQFENLNRLLDWNCNICEHQIKRH